tara:strand:- start:1379 stop:1999 length:621 start_codon:yes stop_codon:yes gene_type:complete
MSLKIFIKFILIFFFMAPIMAGEPGTLEEEIKKNDNKIILKKDKKIVLKKENRVLTKNKVHLPKNPITQLFHQRIGDKIDTTYAAMVGACLPRYKEHTCEIVKPKKQSSHFNKYYYYLNSSKEVNAIIAFSDKRVGNLEQCRSMITEWSDYFKNFDLTNNTDKSNKDQLLLDHANIHKTELSMSCLPEEFRDVKSYFSLKLLIYEH